MAIVRKRLGAGHVAEGPDLPAELAYLWKAYNDLSDTRQNGMGIGPITHLEMVAYAALHGFRWGPEEIVVIRELDRAFLLFQAERMKNG